MSWLFSQALVEEFSEGISLDGKPSALLSGNLIPQAYCAPDKTKAFSRLSRFGMTFAPLTANRGEELLTLYLAGFPAKTSVPLGGGGESPAADQDFGKKWFGLLGKYDPSTHSLKTAQCSLFEDLKPSSVTLPRWGLMRTGELYQRQTLVRHILENASGLWPTPTAHNAKETNAPSEAFRHEPTLASRVGGHLNPTWVEWLMGWPVGWTDLNPLAMDKFPLWQRQHSDF